MGQYPFTSVAFLVIFCLLFGIVQILLDQLGTRWEPAKKVASRLNICYAVASGLFCLYTLWVVFDQGLLSSQPAVLPDALTPLFYIYYMSKLWEVVDIVLVTLMGYPIHVHFRVHHNTTPLLGLILFHHRTYSGLVFMIANTCMHFWVYLYHGGVQNRTTFAFVRFLGHAQLLLGLVCGSWAMAAQLAQAPRVALLLTFNQLIVAEGIPLVLYAVYFALFRVEVTETQSFDELMKRK
jgi:hypothetical protein